MTPSEARAVLGVSASASELEIRNAFKLRSRMFHPDRFAGRPESEVRLATKEFQRLGEARAVLLGDEATGQPHRSRKASTTKPPAPEHVTTHIASDTAADGGLVTVVAPTGSYRLRIPPATSDGAKFRIRGGGSEAQATGHRRDLIVTVHVEQPRSNGAEARHDVPPPTQTSQSTRTSSTVGARVPPVVRGFIFFPLLAIGAIGLQVAYFAVIVPLLPPTTASPPSQPIGANQGETVDDPFSIKPGDCFNELDYNPDSGIISSVKLVDCSEPHENEATKSVSLPDGAYPGVTAVDNHANAECIAAFEDYSGFIYDGLGRYEYGFYSPTIESWGGGDREVLCLIKGYEGPTTGSAKDLGR